ncbi:hypothetical protein BGY98DRAFT_939563 [Russula aff. rugulosa BPL654]|nr:hypothetical protein BGY98DRAFT_939563 [Russula aff. rugulosa BPL654]
MDNSEAAAVHCGAIIAQTRRKKTMINRTGMEAHAVELYTSRDLAHRGVWMVYGNNELQDLSADDVDSLFATAARRCRRSLISPGVVVVPRHSSESQFTMFSRLDANALMVRISTVIESSPSTSQHHRQTHPNADADPNARKLPTNNINAFDNQDETAPMGPVLRRTISRRKRCVKSIASSSAFRYFVASPRASARHFIVIVALVYVDTRSLDARLTSS